MNCKICKKKFQSTRELTIHLIKDHNYGVEDLYNYYEYSFASKKAICPICGKKFEMSADQLRKYKKGLSKGIGCCGSCSHSLVGLVHGSPLKDKSVREKCKQTNLKKYGVENPSSAKEIKDKRKETFIRNYGVSHPSQIIGANVNKFEKMKQTNKEKYGVEYPIQAKICQDRMKKTNLKRYGSEYTVASPDLKEKAKQTNLRKYGVENTFQSEELREKAKQTNLKKYGKEFASQSLEIQEKIKQVNLERYGVEYFCQHEKCSKASGTRISKTNKKFHELLESQGIDNELEYIVENYGYDLRVGDTLIEIDPYFTHNSTIGPTFSNRQRDPIDPNYHLEKTLFAKGRGFHCIHIFDWDSKNKVVNMLIEKEKIFAKNCYIRELKKGEVHEFLGNYHLQGSTKQYQYGYGLFYNDNLIQVMTFGKPRYNKNYEYELLRLCTKPRFSVVGGASKLLKYFEDQVKPKSIISYCDLSKFNGEVYEKLGFTLKEQTKPVKHWYNPKTKRHITDNLLRQRGFDQLHKTSYGKGTNNEKLMKDHGYVEIYDCGQLVFVK